MRLVYYLTRSLHHPQLYGFRNPFCVPLSLTAYTLTNAIYFNAAWEFPFNEETTADGSFYLLDGGEVIVPTMTQTESFSYAEGDNYQAVELPYDGQELSIHVKDDGRIQKRIRLELFHKKEAKRKITRIQDDLLNDDSIFTKKEAADKIEELRAIIQRADAEIARLQSIVQVAKQTEETVEATEKALEKLRNLNLEGLSF